MSQVIPKHMGTIRGKFGQLRSHRCRGCSGIYPWISKTCIRPQLEKDLDNQGHVTHMHMHKVRCGSFFYCQSFWAGNIWGQLDRFGQPGSHGCSKWDADCGSFFDLQNFRAGNILGQLDRSGQPGSHGCSKWDVSGPSTLLSVSRWLCLFVL